MKKIKDYTGQKFGRLSIISFAKRENNKTYFNCLCDCGIIKTLNIANLLNKTTNSCGCLSKELIKNRFTTHGLEHTSEYKSWQSLKKRCYNKNCKDYKYYGERGITVCQEWIDSFENFIKDMGMKPSKEHSIDRINNNLGYFKENCKWATKKEQSNNKRSNRKVINIETNEVFNTIEEAAKSINMSSKELGKRLHRKTSYKLKLNFYE